MIVVCENCGIHYNGVILEKCPQCGSTKRTFDSKLPTCHGGVKRD